MTICFTAATRNDDEEEDDEDPLYCQACDIRLPDMQVLLHPPCVNE